MEFRTTTLALVIAAAASAAGVAVAGETAAQPKVTGTLVYPEPFTLPADAIVRLRLEVAAAPEMPARLVAMVATPTEGKQFPIPFELPYAESDIVAQRRYLVRVSVTAGSQTLFASQKAYPVITGGAPTKLEILLQPAWPGRRIRPIGVSAPSPLESSEWKLVALGETPAAAAPGFTIPSIAFDGMNKQIGGSTGCNRFMGAYAPGEGSALKLDPNGMTMMACPEPATRQETAFLAALRATTAYRIEAGKLELLAGDRVVARFEPGGGAAARTE
jgi:putative lipoprotein